MKRIIYIGIMFLGLLFQQCDLDLYPLDGPTTGTFPATQEEAEMGLLASYKTYSELDASSTHYLHVMDNITDIGYARPSNNYTSAITSSLTSDNAMAGKPWAYHYKTIARCHTVLDNLENIKDDMPEDTYYKIEAELRFIRAYSYSKLVEVYGDVPLVLHALGLDNSDLPRISKSEIQQWIIDEMTTVADNLPVSQSASGNVRAGSVAAYMLKARVALYAQQYSVAADAAKTALDLADGVYSLTAFDNTIDFCNQSYEAGEPECANIFGYNGYDNSREWIWVIEYNQTISGNTHNQAYYMGSRLGKGCSYFGPTQNLIDSYQCLDGLPITESPLYNENSPFTNRDPRLDMYCARPNSRLMGFQFESNASVKKVHNYWPVINGESDEPSLSSNKDATNAYRSFSGYLWRKHTDNSNYETNSSRGFCDQNVGIFRYAELLLIYAEAKIEANDIDASVYDAIDQIRTRAGMPALERNMSQAQLRTALRYERKVELCNDGLRWYDLRRWGIADEVMNGYIYLNRAGNNWTKAALLEIDENANPVYNYTEASNYFTTQEVVYNTTKDEYWPIPQQEVDINPNLEQNPNY